MQKNLKHLVFLVLSILFFFLFYKQLLGLNVLLFEVLLIGISLFLDPVKTYHKQTPFFLIATLLSAIFVLLYGSSIAKAVNIVSFVFLIAYRSAPTLRSPLLALRQALLQVYRLPSHLIVNMSGNNQKSKQNLKSTLYFLRIILIPLIVIVIFFLLYASGNSRFLHLIQEFGNSVDVFLNRFFADFSLSAVFVFILGVYITGSILYQRRNEKLEKRNVEANDDLLRKRKWKMPYFNTMDLKKEIVAMVFLLFALNAMLLVLNCIDFNWVWLHFKWNGEELKEFVHTGTYMLLVAILVSIGIALYIFRGNTNFYGKSKLLKTLTYIWLGQNLFMVCSVGMRTYRYIQHYNLAYLRIGLLYFLLAVILFIVFVMLKIKYRKSVFYLTRHAAFSTFIVFFLLCPFDWDKIIINYNFKHIQTGYVHKDWTMTLSDKTLPLIHKNLKLMEADIDSNSWHYGKAESYKEYFIHRKYAFLKEYPNRSIWSWNLADAKAYNYLKKE